MESDSDETQRLSGVTKEMELGTQSSVSMISQTESGTECVFKSSTMLMSQTMETASWTPSSSQGATMDISQNYASEKSESVCDDTMEQDEVIGKDVDDGLNGLNSQSDTISAFDGAMSSDDLRQFDVLDDLERDDHDQDGSDYESDSNDSMDSDVPDEEIEAMLEEGLS